MTNISPNFVKSNPMCSNADIPGRTDAVWLEKFAQMLKNKPESGSYLESLNGEPIPVRVETKPDRGFGETRLMWVYAIVADDLSGWVLSGSSKGVVCQLSAASQLELIERNGGSDEGLTVSRLYVIRQNYRGTALRCELTTE